MRRVITLMVVTALIAGLQVGGASTAATARSSAHVRVVGGYVNHAHVCNGQSTSDPNVVQFECTGGALWNGGFTGQTRARLTATMDLTTFDVAGTYEDLFIGRHVSDGSDGTMLFRGTFTIDGATKAFEAHARIVEGTCAFAGSTGFADYAGNLVDGGYVVKWIRPKKRAASDPACVVDSVADALTS